MGRWRKVLYLQQPYPDNYVDPAQFLDGLRKNGKVRRLCKDFGGDMFISFSMIMYSFHGDISLE